MYNRIETLPDNLTNQIAAGEVVERPASVVKELVENALDAGAREIRVETVEGGRRLIRVSDDGEGMGPEDARASLRRHATSKIRSISDLHAVTSYGFRGEALPSIASVSKIRLVTKPHSDLTATEIQIAGGKEERVEECGGPDGTLVEVTDLFFNTPARLKFLRSPAVEASHVTGVIERLALARPDVGFTLVQNGRAILSARKGVPLAERIAEVLGAEQGGNLLPIDFEGHGLIIEGYLSPPDRTYPNPRLVYLFVNGRPIRDRPLQHAVISAAREVIPQDRFPLSVLQIQLAADAVDGNVHPAKLEVRFRDARAAYEAVRRSVLTALRGWDPMSGLPPPEGQPPYKDRVQESLDRFLTTTARPPSAREGGSAAEEAESALPEASPGDALSAGRSSLRYLGQAHETYLVFESTDGIVLLDQHAAHERVVFERLRAQAAAGPLPSQALLVPRTVELTSARRMRMEERKDQLERLGFELEPFGGNTVAIKAVPMLLQNVDVAKLLGAVADDLEEADTPETIDRALHRALATIACHAVVRAGQKLEQSEVESLVAQMGDTPGSGTCPHGRPVAIRFPRKELERLFRRT